MSKYKRRVTWFINARRMARGRRPVRRDACANEYAQRWAEKLASSELFYHSKMMDLINHCNSVYAGEILGRGSISPKTVVRLWMHSDIHRRVMLSKNPRRCGVGVARQADGQLVIAVVFIRR